MFDQTNMLRDDFGEFYTNHEEPNMRTAKFLNNMSGYGKIQSTCKQLLLLNYFISKINTGIVKGFNELLFLLGDTMP